MTIDKQQRPLTPTGESQRTKQLRHQAEAQLQAHPAEAPSPRTEEELQRLVHELEVHQIELQMQNAELVANREALERSLEKYADLYDFAPVGFVTLDCDGTITTVNLRGASHLGVERSRLVGRRFGLFVAETARLSFAKFLEQVFAGQGKITCELELLSEAVSELFVQIEAEADASSRECRIALINISERRLLDAELKFLHSALETRAGELEAANLDLEAFNSTVSHDLRRPLTTINGYCQVIQQLCCSKLSEECQGYIGEIYAGTLRMNRLIDTMLNFSRVTRGEVCRERINLSELAEEVALSLKVTAPERRITFKLAAGVMVSGDAGLLRVVLDNLLGNAWKHTGERDFVVIEFGTTRVDGKTACFIRDNGPGFDLAQAEQLFAPFQRLPGTVVEGFGIGLATVDRIIRRHGGRVWAESAPGKGATFFFTLE